MPRPAAPCLQSQSDNRSIKWFLSPRLLSYPESSKSASCLGWRWGAGYSVSHLSHWLFCRRVCFVLLLSSLLPIPMAVPSSQKGPEKTISYCAHVQLDTLGLRKRGWSGRWFLFRNGVPFQNLDLWCPLSPSESLEPTRTCFCSYVSSFSELKSDPRLSVSVFALTLFSSIVVTCYTFPSSLAHFLAFWKSFWCQ